MSILNNRVDTVLTPDQQITLRKAFGEISNILSPFMQALTPEERQRIPKMNVANKSFVADAVIVLKGNPDFIPAYLEAEKVENDYRLYEQLDEFLAMAESISEKLSDTQMVAGSEAYLSALATYRLTAAASLAGINGADSANERLAARFDGQGKTGISDLPAAETPAS